MKKTEETKEIIVNSAKIEFAEHGYSGARMSSIAKRSGINKALIHYYFNSKEELYKYILENIFNDPVNQSLNVYKTDWKLNPPQKLFTVIYFMAKTHPNLSNNYGYRIYFWELAEGSKFLAPFIKKYTLPRMSIILKIIQDGIDGNYFQSENPHYIIFHLGSLFETYHIHKRNIEGSEWYDKIYGEKENSLLDYSLEFIFRMLLPGDEGIKLPKMEDDIMNFIDTLINKFNSGDISEMSGENFCKFISMLID